MFARASRSIAMIGVSSLRTRIGLHVALLVAASLAVGVGAAVGIQSLHRDIGVAGRGYRQLRQTYEIGFNVATSRSAIEAENPAAARGAIDRAIVLLESARPEDAL